MILTPIPHDCLPQVLAAFRAGLAMSCPEEPAVLAAFDRIAATRELMAAGADLPEHRLAAVTLCRRAGLPLRAATPATGFSWDGRAVSTETEASVLIHEVAHWLIAPESRRTLPDFGLGAGPETGRRTDADAARVVDPETEQREESLASLLGILWEAALDQPAILSFMEQNWLEGYDRPAAWRHFSERLGELRQRGLVDAHGRPRFPERFACLAITAA